MLDEDILRAQAHMREVLQRLPRLLLLDDGTVGFQAPLEGSNHEATVSTDFKPLFAEQAAVRKMLEEVNEIVQREKCRGKEHRAPGGSESMGGGSASGGEG